MDNADSEHSISRSISIPQWMRPRLQDGFDAEISTLSPPNQDDSFFYIPYSKLTKPVTNTPAPSVVSAAGENSQPSQFSGPQASSSSASLISKHTQPCMKFLGDGKTMDIDLADFVGDDKKTVKPVKSFGTDDGFKSEAAQCGHSVVQVAQQMIADRLVGRPKKLSSENDQIKGGYPEVPHFKPRVRRGSKSLPASPLSTPDSTPQIQRKNRYFTAAFVEPPEESSKFPGSWLVAGLLGAHRENLSESLTDLSSDSNNNASIESRKSADETKPESSQSEIASSIHVSKSITSSVKSGTSGIENTVKKTRPKPSELREMNFWSPTSM